MSDVTQQIKDRLDIVSFIKEYLELKPAGSNFKACCPFHHEDTPSFMVSSAKQMFKCFGCGKGGDVFTFLQEYEGIEFKEALKLLADKTGVRIPTHERPQYEHHKNTLFDMLALTARFYMRVLKVSPSAEIARAYVKRRGIDELTAETFRVGYSLESWDALYRFLKSRGFFESDMVKSGLIGKNSSGNYFDKFRGRLMFPITDVYGRIIGFGGRILTDEKTQAKYINTAQTDVYDKSAVLYGLDKAKEAIRREGRAVIVEGYMDVIASHEADVKNVVAASGTALTNEQLRLLKRFTNTISLAFDMDTAGIAAALRSYQLAHTMGMNIQVIRIEGGKDPDELIRKDKTLWEHAVVHGMHVVDFYFEHVTKSFNLQSLDDKKRVRDALLPLIALIEDPVEHTHFLEKLALLVGVTLDELKKTERAFVPSQQAVRGEVKAASSKQEHPSLPEKQARPLIEQVAEHLLSLMFRYPSRLPKELHLPDISLTSEALSYLYKAVRSAYNSGQLLEHTTLMALQEAHGAYVDELLLLADKDYAEMDSLSFDREIERLKDTLHHYFAKERRSFLIRALKDAERRGDEQATAALVEEINGLIVSSSEPSSPAA